MKIKEFVSVLIDVKCSDRLIIYDAKTGGAEVYYGYVNENPVSKYLENRKIDGMFSYITLSIDLSLQLFHEFSFLSLPFSSK